MQTKRPVRMQFSKLNWAKAVPTTTYLINQMPTSVVNDIYPLRVCLSFTHDRKMRFTYVNGTYADAAYENITRETHYHVCHKITIFTMSNEYIQQS